MEPHAGSFLLDAVLYLAAAVIAVPFFRRLGLGSILGYLAAGLAIGPYGLGLVGETENVLEFAELGVVLLLFVIGLELVPRRLIAMSKSIAGLGLTQVVLTGLVFTGLAMFPDISTGAAVAAGLSMALSSTAFGIQILKERGELNTSHGRAGFAILLLQDISIVPLLGLVAILSDGSLPDGNLFSVGMVVGAVLAVILAGRFLLNPLFHLIAQSGSREMLAAAALLTVFGVALLMELVGLSMAMGAFLAGVMLAESEFRHQLESDIEPFRGLLLGLFFLAVGMSLNIAVVADFILIVLGSVGALLLIKAVILYGIGRVIARLDHRSAMLLAAMLSQGGEFAFVIIAAGVQGALFTSTQASILTAIVILSMAATPLLTRLVDRFVKKEETTDGLEAPSKALKSNVIIAGFGRMGQTISQILASCDISVTAIDNDPQRIRIARKFENRVYYGDARRLDILEAAGAGEADLIILAMGSALACNSTIEAIRKEFPDARLLVRAYDREHALQLMDMDVDYYIRETFESSVLMGRKALELIGTKEQLVEDIITEFRRYDMERLNLQKSRGMMAAPARSADGVKMEVDPPTSGE